MSKLLKLSLVLFVLAAVAGFLFLRRPKPAADLPAPTATSSRSGSSAQPESKPAAPVRLEGAGETAARSQPESAGPEKSARVRLRLVDETTRAPVPFLAAALHDQTELLERLESDAEGFLRGSTRSTSPPSATRAT
jgi:hypothetical protein